MLIKVINNIQVYNCGYPYSKYFISENGMYLYSMRSNRWMTYHINSNGYYSTRITDDSGKVATTAIHKIMCNTFHTKILDSDIILHIDNNKLNIHKNNLRYGSTQENIEQEHAKLFYLCKDDRTLEIYNLTKFCSENSLDISRMYSLLHGRIESYKGYTCNIKHKIDSTKGKPKLTIELVILLRYIKHKFNISYSELSTNLFDKQISFTTICNAVRGNSWKTVPFTSTTEEVELAALECLEQGLLNKGVSKIWQ